MKWKKGETSVSLSLSDIKLMAQCNMSFVEILHRETHRTDIPPLWSVMSYAMLRYNGNVNGIWRYYRFLRDAAADTKKAYYHCQIPKANGGVRMLYIPYYALQREQFFIMDTILAALPVDSHAYAYRKGVCMEQCAEPHVRKGVLIHLDIRDFFGSITEEMVQAVLCESTGYSRALCRFLARMCCLNGCLPQGAVTSPMLSNIVFRRCDVALTEFAQRYGLDYSRYSDDLFFSGSEDVDIKAVLKGVAEILLPFGFRINTQKTKIRKAQHRQSVLGLTVNDHVQVNREYRRKLMQELYYLERFGKNCEGALACGDYLKYMQQLQGKLAYVMHTDPGNTGLLEAHLKLSQRLHNYARHVGTEY